MPSEQSFVVQAAVPGMVTDVLVHPGDDVVVGQELFLVESMKMETPLLAERAGHVVEILVETGETVEGGQVLMRLQDV
jgi:biotin carboxyl carrier protein